jgi:hypothetical protein
MTDKQPRMPYSKDTPQSLRLSSSFLDSIRVLGWKPTQNATLVNTFHKNGVIVSIQATSRLAKNFHLVISKNDGVVIRLLTQSEILDFLRKAN